VRRYLRDSTFSRFDTIPECDRHTHTHTHTHRHTTTAYTALSIASRGKNCLQFSYYCIRQNSVQALLFVDPVWKICKTLNTITTAQLLWFCTVVIKLFSSCSRNVDTAINFGAKSVELAYTTFIYRTGIQKQMRIAMPKGTLTVVVICLHMTEIWYGSVQ